MAPKKKPTKPDKPVIKPPSKTKTEGITREAKKSYKPEKGK